MSHISGSLTRREFLNGIAGSVLAVSKVDGIHSPTAAHDPSIHQNHIQIDDDLPPSVMFRRGHSPIIVASPRSPFAHKVLHRLTEYLSATLGVRPEIKHGGSGVPALAQTIVLAYAGEGAPRGVVPPAGSPEGFALATRSTNQASTVILAGNSDHGLRRAVDRFILVSEQNPDGLEIPPLNISEKPWIPQREWTIPGHEPRSQVFGIFNPYADQRLDVYHYSRRQITGYVEMYGTFGFTGMQLTDTCYDWGVWGSEDAFHDRLRAFAEIAKEDGQNVTLRPWCADFCEANWYEPDVTYKAFWSTNLAPSPGQSAFEDPQVRKVFEKYYDLYADLAPYLDLVIGYYDDPGTLSIEDSFKYLRLLESKMKARNPAIKMALNCWGRRLDYLKQLGEQGLPDYLLLEAVRPPKTEADAEEFHRAAAKYNWNVGVWGWYDADIETDQAAAMYVFSKKLKQLYGQVKNGAAQIHPISYWSEMEAYHLCDIYSMYVAGQLLWDPDRDPDKLLDEVTQGIWGPRNGPKVLTALHLIEDVRSAHWDLSMNPVLGTVHPVEDLHRAEHSLAELQNLEPDRAFVPKFPLPFSSATLVDVMLPHLQQIREFAAWRIEFNDVRKKFADGASKEETVRQINKIWQPVPGYNTWTGTYGPMERKSQELLIRNFAREADISVSAPGWLQFDDANCALQCFRSKQILSSTEWRFSAAEANSGLGADWSLEKMNDCLRKLVADGCLERMGKDSYRLANWKDYARWPRNLSAY